MKLSEMNTMQLADAICKITPAVARIMEDPKTLDALKQYPEEGSAPKGVLIMKAGALLAPVLLGDHLRDTATVLAALTGKTAEQILQQKGSETIKDITACLDTELIDFFMPSAGTEATQS